VSIDQKRLSRYLLTIRENLEDLESLLEQHSDYEFLEDRLLTKSLKYCLIEIAEALSDILQHLLARKKGIAADGYVDVALKAKQHNVVPADLIERLLFFFKFRNILVHRYWQVDDNEVLKNTRQGIKDFRILADIIENIIAQETAAGNAKSR